MVLNLIEEKTVQLHAEKIPISLNEMIKVLIYRIDAPLIYRFTL